jgi:ribosome-binding protein aMBF1 (putative translation factor)
MKPAPKPKTPPGYPAKWPRRSKTDLLRELANRSSSHALVRSRIRLWLPVQIRHMREARGWTQEQLAAAASMQAPAISRIESTRAALLRIETLLRLARALDKALIVEFVSFDEFRLRVARSDRQR